MARLNPVDPPHGVDSRGGLLGKESRGRGGLQSWTAGRESKDRLQRGDPGVVSRRGLVGGNLRVGVDSREGIQG